MLAPEQSAFIPKTGHLAPSEKKCSSQYRLQAEQENRSTNKILTATVKWGVIFILRNG